MGPRADRIAVLILLLLVVAGWLPRLRGPIDLRWDAGVYYVLGTSLSEGKGYRLLNEPGEIEATLYPPLLPAIVAAHQFAVGTTDPVVVGRWLRGFFAALFAALVVATYLLLRTAARVPYAFLGTFVCTLTFLPIWLSDRCYTDIPFALAAVLFVGRRAASGAPASRAWAGVLAVAAYLLRTVGVALVLAWIVEAVARRQYRKGAVRLAVALVPILAWQTYVHRVQEGSKSRAPGYIYQRADYNIYNVTYGQLFSLRDHLNPELGKATAGERARRAIAAIPSIVKGLGGAISQPEEHWQFVFERLSRVPVVKYFARWRAIAATMTFLGILAVVGLMVQLKQGEVLLPVATLAYLAGLCLMPSSYFSELPRYVCALSPLLMLSSFRAVSAVQRVRHRLPRGIITIGVIACGALAAFIVSLGLFTVIRAYNMDLRPVVHRDWNGHFVEYRLFSYTDYDAFDGGLEWLKQKAASTDVVASTTPQWVYLRTGLRSVFPPFERDPAHASKLMDSVPVRYVAIADWLSRARALPIVQAEPARWRVVYADGAFAIYERGPNP